MLIYEVNLEVDREVEEAFATWLRPHMEEMLTFAGFLEADWWVRQAEDEGSQATGVLWTVQYRVKDRAALERYFERDAKRMREDGLARFAGKMKANRRILSFVGSAKSGAVRSQVIS